MSRANTAREALIAEALGDVARLLDRLEALMPALDEAQRAQRQASKALAAQAQDFETRMLATTEHAKKVTAQFIAKRADDVARATLAEQTGAMKQAARLVFQDEVAAAVIQLVVPLNRLVEQVNRPWLRWLTHAATAVSASAVSWACAAYVWAR